MINYTLPDFTVNLGLNLFFVRLLRERPEMAREGVAVTSLYGCFPGCVMNGGRTYLRERTSPAAMERTFAIMAEYGLVPRLTFTNSLVSEETLADPYFNDICLAAARLRAARPSVYDDAAGAYLRENYGMPLVLSTTREVADAATFNGLARAYDWIVLSYNIHKDPVVLGALAAPEKAEIMVNEFCVPAAPTAPSTTATTAPISRTAFCDPSPAKAAAPTSSTTPRTILSSSPPRRSPTRPPASASPPSRSSAAGWPLPPWSRRSPITSSAPNATRRLAPCSPAKCAAPEHFPAATFAARCQSRNRSQIMNNLLAFTPPRRGPAYGR